MLSGVDTISPSEIYVPDIDYVLYLLWMVLKKSEVSDIQQGLIDLGVIIKIQTLLPLYEKTKLDKFALCIAVIRRLISCTEIASSF